MTNVVDFAVRKLPAQTRLHALEEGRRDPRFWGYFSKLALSENPSRAVDDSMKKAAINELDPRRYPEARGQWPVFRAKMRQSMSVIGSHFATHGNLSALARFIGGLGDDETPQFVTSLNMEETGVSTPLPGLVTSLDTESPSSSGSGIPGLVTSLSQESPSSSQAPFNDPSAGPESKEFKDSLDKPASSSAPAPVRTSSAPAAKPAAAPAASTGPSIWQTIASALTTAGGAAASVYGQVVQKQAATKAQQTLLSAQQQAALKAQQAAAIRAGTGLFGTSGATSYILYGLLGLLGVGGMLMLSKGLGGAGSGGSRRRSR